MPKTVKPSVPLEVIEKMLKKNGQTLADWGLEHLKPTGMDIGKGVHLKEGTILLAPYHDDVYKARIVGGKVVIEGEGIKGKQTFTNLPEATNFITNSFREGATDTTSVWAFWIYVRDPKAKSLFRLMNLRDPDFVAPTEDE